MLSAYLFDPLDLDLDLDMAEEEDPTGHTAINLLIAAIRDPRASGDESISEYLSQLINRSRDAGRERDAILTERAVADREGEFEAWLYSDIARLHLRLGEREIAVDILNRTHLDQQSRPPEERDVDFYSAASILADTRLGDRELTDTFTAEAQRLAELHNDSATLALLQLGRDHSRLRTASRTPAPAAAPGSRAAASPSSPPKGALYRVAYLPPAEHAAARQQNLLEATMHRDHADYRRELQHTLLAMTAQSGARAAIVPLDVAGLLEFAARRALPADRRSTRLAYNDSLADAGRDIPWPPERNAACWCGSERKYKKCCGTPGFTSVKPADPASMTLRITLDHVRPAVWRRVAAPSNLPLDALHGLIQSAMGWDDTHSYAFEVGDSVFVDPQSRAEGLPADSERLVSVASEIGERFSYVYDFGDQWTHTLTVEKIDEAGPDNRAMVLDGAGACPPEDCGGAHRYTRLMIALADAGHRDHEEALDLLGAGFDPTRR